MYKYLILFLSFIGLVSCDTYSEKELEGFDATISSYVEKQTEKFERSESGLYYFIESEGEGEEYIKLTDVVTFAYEGRLLDGTVFDRRTADNPITYESKVLIEGWKEGFAYLKKGGRAKLVIPPQLGYADNELPAIPKNSVLVFDVEVLDIQ